MTVQIVKQIDSALDEIMARGAAADLTLELGLLTIQNPRITEIINKMTDAQMNIVRSLCPDSHLHELNLKPSITGAYMAGLNLGLTILSQLTKQPLQ